MDHGSIIYTSVNGHTVSKNDEGHHIQWGDPNIWYRKNKTVPDTVKSRYWWDIEDLTCVVSWDQQFLNELNKVFLASLWWAK